MLTFIKIGILIAILVAVLTATIFAMKNKKFCLVKSVGLSFLLLAVVGCCFVTTGCKKNYSVLNNKSYVMHASGSVKVNGKVYDYTNTIDNFQSCYDAGFRYFEFDFMLSSDNKIIGQHDYRYIPEYSDQNPIDYQTFKNYKILGELEPVVVENLVEKLKVCPEAYIVFDYKNPSEYIKFFDEFVLELQELNALNMLNRFVPQCYSNEMFRYMKNHYDFEQYIYTNYISYYTADQMIEYFKDEEKIKFLTMWWWTDANECLKLKNEGFNILVHTVNSCDDMLNLVKEKQVDGFYTDNTNVYELIK